MRTLALYILIVLVAGCSNKEIIFNNSTLVVYGPGEIHTKWKNKMIDKCRLEAAIVTISKYEANLMKGIGLTKEDVTRIGNWLEFECMHYYGLDT